MNIEMSQEFLSAAVDVKQKQLVLKIAEEYSKDIDDYPKYARKYLAQRTMKLLLDVIDVLDERYDVGWNKEIKNDN